MRPRPRGSVATKLAVLARPGHEPKVASSSIVLDDKGRRAPPKLAVEPRIAPKVEPDSPAVRQGKRSCIPAPPPSPWVGDALHPPPHDRCNDNQHWEQAGAAEEKESNVSATGTGESSSSEKYVQTVCADTTDEEEIQKRSLFLRSYQDDRPRAGAVYPKRRSAESVAEFTEIHKERAVQLKKQQQDLSDTIREENSRQNISEWDPGDAWTDEEESALVELCRRRFAEMLERDIASTKGQVRAWKIVMRGRVRAAMHRLRKVEDLANARKDLADDLITMADRRLTMFVNNDERKDMSGKSQRDFQVDKPVRRKYNPRSRKRTAANQMASREKRGKEQYVAKRSTSASSGKRGKWFSS